MMAKLAGWELISAVAQPLVIYQRYFWPESGMYELARDLEGGDKRAALVNQSSLVPTSLFSMAFPAVALFFLIDVTDEGISGL
jgi:hypothetical protein